jgi:uncharacterized protein (DUF2062 family)
MKVAYMIAWFTNYSLRLLHLERDSSKLALGVSLGIYIALSPFIGFHTAMAFLFAWLFGLNVAILLSVSMLINNPWTMVPVYGSGYWFGDWLLSKIGIAHYALNPSWMSACNNWLRDYLPKDGISLWAFLVGGNLLGILLALISYVPVKRFIALLTTENKNRVLRTMDHSKQMVHSLQQKAAPMLRNVTQKARARKTMYETGSSK